MIKLPKKDTTRQYELTYLAPASYTETELQKLLDEVTAAVTKQKGSVISSDSWGKKRLAYVIRANKVEHREALFVHLVVELPSENAPKLERAMLLNNQVIRHLLVKADDSVTASPEEEN